jgi:hypothetical protein
MTASSFRIIALIATYNEEDIIEPVLLHLASEGVDSYVIDNRSTDGTVEKVRSFIGRGVIGVETFSAPGVERDDSRFHWAPILARKEALAKELDADWFIHHDADEVRESPWGHLRLREAIELVDRLGYSAIDSEVLNFWPTTDVPESADPVRAFRYCEHAGLFDRLQVKTWKKTVSGVDLVTSGGHDATFEERRIFPLRFIIRHYPIRSDAHGARKVFCERRPRFAADERQRGWHVQYDGFEPGTTFVRDPASMTLYDAEQTRVHAQIHHRLVEQLEEEVSTLRRNADQVDRRIGALERQLVLERGEQTERIRELEVLLQQRANELRDVGELFQRQVATERREQTERITELEGLLLQRANELQDVGEVFQRQLATERKEQTDRISALEAIAQERGDEVIRIGDVFQEQLTHEREEQTARISALETAIAGRDRELSALRTGVAEAQRQLEQNAHVLADREQTMLTLNRELADTRANLRAITGENEHLRARVAEMRRHLDEVYASRSWRVTAPLRALLRRTPKGIL